MSESSPDLVKSQPAPAGASKTIPADRPIEKRGSVTVATYFHQGPLPPPEYLRGYNEILPGAADRILNMAEREQAHRHGQADMGRREDINLARRGQLFGLLIGLWVTAIGGLLVYSGYSLAGFGMFLTGLAGLVGAFIYSKDRREKTPPGSDEKPTETPPAKPAGKVLGSTPDS